MMVLQVSVRRIQLQHLRLNVQQECALMDRVLMKPLALKECGIQVCVRVVSPEKMKLNVKKMVVIGCNLVG